MKWTIAQRRDDKAKAAWERFKMEPVDSRLFGLRRFKVVNIIPATSLESGTECYFVEVEGSLLEYLIWKVGMKGRTTILEGWLSEKGRLMT